MNYKTEAIILRAREVNEFDRIYDIFCQNFGKISVIAKGVRKPTAKLSSGLEPITHSEIFLTKGRFLDRVTGVIIHDQYSNLKKDLDRIKFIKPVFLMFNDSFSEIGAQQEEIFNLVKKFLTEMTKEKVDFSKMRLMRLHLIWKILCLSGSRPELFICSECQNKFSSKDQSFWFSSTLEIYCSSCGPKTAIRKMSVNQTIIKIFRFIIGRDWNFLRKIAIKESDLRQVEKITQISLESLLNMKIFLN